MKGLSGKLTVESGDPVSYLPAFRQWMEIHEVPINECYRVEMDFDSGVATIYTYKRNERGSFYREFNENIGMYGEIAKNDPYKMDMKIGLKVTRPNAN